MASQIDYRYSSKFPAAVVYAALVDPEYLKARLAELGGREASVVEHHADAAGATFRLRHELDVDGMPSIVRSMLSGNLVVERAEHWTTQPDGSHSGTVDVAITGSPVPAGAKGELGLTDLADGGSEFRVRADVSVGVPLFGGRIEEYVAGQIHTLLDLESQFTTRWLEQHTH